MESSDLARQFIQHRDLLYGYVFALTRDHEVAEDLVQDVGVSILTEATHGTASRINFVPWARGLARHRVTDHYRRVWPPAASTRCTLRNSPTPWTWLLPSTRRTPEDNHAAAQAPARMPQGELTARVRTMIDLRYTRPPVYGRDRRRAVVDAGVDQGCPVVAPAARWRTVWAASFALEEEGIR